jgi:hypothetical protein
MQKLKINENEDFLVESEIKIYRNLLKNIGTCKDTQYKISLVMKDRQKINEFKILLKIINESFKEEWRLDQKGTAYYLVGIFTHCLNSYEFWHKLILVIGSERYKSTREALKDVIEINCIYKKVMDTIELYFKSLDCVDDEYFVSEEKLPEDIEKQELLQKIQFNHIAIIVHFLLHHQKLGIKTANELFVYSSYDDDFINYLKNFINSLTLL